MGILGNDAPELTGRTIAMELICAFVPQTCVHLMKEKFGKSNLYRCKGCNRLFKDKNAEHPIDIFGLIQEWNSGRELRDLRKLIGEMELLKQVLEKRITAMKLKQLDLQYFQSKRPSAEACASEELKGAETHG